MKFNTLKYLLTLQVAFAFATGSLMAQTAAFSGTSLVSAGGNLSLTAGDVGVYIANNANNFALWQGFSGIGKIDANLSLTNSATYTPIGTSSVFTFLASQTAAGASTVSLSGNMPSISLSGGVDSGDSYAVIVFEQSTTTTIAGDIYRIWGASNVSPSQASWVIPNSGATLGWNTTPSASAQQQIRDSSFLIAQGTVVPEPSTYALMALGGLVLFFIARRRKAQQQA